LFAAPGALKDTSQMCTALWEVFIKLHYLPAIQVEIKVDIVSVWDTGHVLGGPRGVMLAVPDFKLCLLLAPLIIKLSRVHLGGPVKAMPGDPDTLHPEFHGLNSFLDLLENFFHFFRIFFFLFLRLSFYFC